MPAPRPTKPWPFPQRARARGLLFAPILLSACAGGDAAPPAPLTSTWPAGTVMTLDGAPVLAEEIDRAAARIALIEPQDSLLQLRRVALTNLVFPQRVASTLAPEDRARARASAEEWHAALVAGTMPTGPLAGPVAVERMGRWVAFDPAVWSLALDLPLNTWSPVVEGVGAYHVFQVLGRSSGNTPGLVEFTIRAYEFPYLDVATGRAAIEAGLDRARLTILDEGWRDAVPTYWQHRMRGGSP